MKVIDYSAILRSNLDFRDQDFIMPSKVYAEVADENIKILIDYAIRIKSIKIIDPKEESVEKIISTARESGDIEKVSKADIDVLALGLEYSAIILSDDYAIQNIASTLGLKYETTHHEGIKETVKWIKRCSGCGREYDTGFKGDCSVCGSKILRKKK